ncbi:MAG: ATPase, T2SS/T4P/T4SS family [candidate division Zixibacteria bacterium]
MTPEVLQKKEKQSNLVSDSQLTAPDIQRASKTEANSLTPENTHKHSVLLVDDEIHVLKALKRVFASEDYNILTAENAANALDILTQNSVTLIISDQRMPQMSGTELLRIIRERYPKIIRIMLTGNSDTDTVMQAVNNGAVYKFITKPWNDNDLLLTIRLALKQYDLIQENAALKKISRDKEKEIAKLKQFAGAKKSTLSSALASKGQLAPGQIEMLEKYCAKNNCALVKGIIELGMIDESELFRFVYLECKTEHIVLEKSTLDIKLAKLFPREICEAGCFVPVNLKSNNLLIAMADPLDLMQIDYLSFKTQYNIQTRLAQISEIDNAIKYIYYDFENDGVDYLDDLEFGDGYDKIDVLLDDEVVETPEQLMKNSESPSAIKMANAIVSDAIKIGASDIHIEPKPKYSLVRYRVDGLLQTKIKYPSVLHSPTVSRLKILAKIDITERRIPQDGRISVKTCDKIIDIRMSTMPTIYGEKIVCRLLDKTASIWTLDKIGISGELFKRLENIINIPQGLIIATGPTGSGKTTSLYSMMNERSSPTLNMVTIEDPVEYLMDDAAQVHIHEKIGLTFAATLRSALRQDPDIILVGEIRDYETAMAAFQASMTGHLVFTTLHTNSTIATISRLLHIGIEPFLVASAVNGIFAQRLARRICPYCKDLQAYDRELITKLGVTDRQMPDELFYGKGCEHCNQTGFIGRIGIFEIFQMTEEFRQFLTTNFKETELSHMAHELGMETLLDDAINKVKEGVTTLEEILRILGPTAEYEINCPKCNYKLDPDFLNCPQCGLAQKILCKSCKSQLLAEWKLCPHCGIDNPFASKK